MRVFVLRARKGPTASDHVDGSFRAPGHFEIVANSISNALFISNDIRGDVVFHVALEGPPDPPKIVTFDSRNLTYFGGFDETSVAVVVEKALDASARLGKDEWAEADSGVRVARMSFEHLVRELAESAPLYVLSRRGTDIREAKLAGNGCFLFSDHIPMQKKSFHLLKRLRAERISLGPVMLFAAHCIILVHNELDRRQGM